MPETAALDEAIEIFGQIGSVISGAFQSLRHEQDLKARRVALGHSFGEMFLEQSVADAVDVFIHLKNLAGAIQIEI
jgi:hypothetical protein